MSSEQSLTDVKVLEYGHSISTAFCAKLLVGMGAEVIKIEPPGTGDALRKAGPFRGDIPHPEKSGIFFYLNCDKKGITLKVDTYTGKEIFFRLVSQADVLIEDLSPAEEARLGLAYQDLRALNPRLVVTSITPFGKTGPYSNYKGSDLINYHASSMGYGTPGLVDNPKAQPPIRAGAEQGEFGPGLSAAVATVAAILSQRHDGEGCHLDISAQEALAVMMGAGFAGWSYDKVPTNRDRAASDRGAGFGAGGLLPAKNGFFQLHAVEPHHWNSFVEVMGSPEWARDPRYQERLFRAQHWAEIEPGIKEWAKNHTKEDVSRWCQEHHVPCLPVNDPASVFEAQQLRARAFFVQAQGPEIGTVTMPGANSKLSATLWRLKESAPTLGQHNYEVLCQRLGYAKQDLVKLRAAGII